MCYKALHKFLWRADRRAISSVSGNYSIWSRISTSGNCISRSDPDPAVQSWCLWVHQHPVVPYYIPQLLPLTHSFTIFTSPFNLYIGISLPQLKSHNSWQPVCHSSDPGCLQSAAKLSMFCHKLSIPRGRRLPEHCIELQSLCHCSCFMVS